MSYIALHKGGIALGKGEVDSSILSGSTSFRGYSLPITFSS
jgi:hypothetical protein